MRMKFAAVAAAVVVAAPGLAQQERTDMRLRDAGFKVRLAVTGEQIAHLKRVPPRTMLSRTKDGRVSYIYADPDFCKCVLFGDEVALSAYRAMTGRDAQQPDQVGARGISPMGEAIREMNSDDIGPSDMFDIPF